MFAVHVSRLAKGFAACAFGIVVGLRSFADALNVISLLTLVSHIQVSKPELTPEQKATIRQTVVRELTPLRTFRKAHSHEIVINPTSPTKPPPRAPSVDFNMTYVLPNSTAVCPSLPVDINPLSPPAWGPIHRAPSHRTSQDSVRSSEIPEDSPGIVWAEQRQPRRASQDSMRSSFGAERAEHAGATAWTPFAQNTTRLSQDTSSNSGDSETGILLTSKYAYV